MKYVDEFRNKDLVSRLAAQIYADADRERIYNIMEVCGTHTMSIFRFGLKKLLPENIHLISGPGCPVCVTPNDFLDKAIWLSKAEGVTIVTFGDMIKIPGSHSSLEKAKADASNVRIVYSSMDALDIARKNKKEKIVFLGIGFETTAPTVAQSILMAKDEGIKNYHVLCGNKTMPEALEVLVKENAAGIDGFMLPGHVSAVIGTKPYAFLADKYKKRCVIAGFEPVDILQSILMLIRQVSPKVEIQYTRITSKDGNPMARKAIDKVFEKRNSTWRGMGVIRRSGFAIRKEFAGFDAEKVFKIKITKPVEDKRCICGEVLKGVKIPSECTLFGKICNPENPIGACMVSGEGTCAAYYKYTFKE